jgi:antagonist of KipI
MKILVKKGGPLTTLQDLGRYGYQKFGVLVSGAMDDVSLRLANLLVQNNPGEGALEMTMSGPLLVLPAGLTFALTGADMKATLDGKPVPTYRPVYVRRKATLAFGFAQTGCRAYLAVAGGFDVPPVMESKSTYLRAKIGGVEGRALKAGDELAIGTIDPHQAAFVGRMERSAKGDAPFVTVPWSIDGRFVFNKGPIRVTEGLQYDWFKEESLKAFVTDSYTITTQADRMGYRLDGTKLEFKEKRDLISEPVTFGAIQVPADGKPIILMADRQTTGGYAKIGQVILVDLPRLAQLRPGDSIHFEWTTLTEAEQKYAKQEGYMGALKDSLAEALKKKI